MTIDFDEFDGVNQNQKLSDIKLLHFVVRENGVHQILHELQEGPRRLSQLHRAIPGASKKMLVETLHALKQKRV